MQHAGYSFSTHLVASTTLVAAQVLHLNHPYGHYVNGLCRSLGTQLTRIGIGGRLGSITAVHKYQETVLALLSLQTPVPEKLRL